MLCGKVVRGLGDRVHELCRGLLVCSGLNSVDRMRGVCRGSVCSIWLVMRCVWVGDIFGLVRNRMHELSCW